MASASREDAAASFEPLRPKLMRVAYRTLGAVADWLYQSCKPG
jgi:RNA polymerase sigma-70 factor (ECF subfamily)